MKKMRWLVAVVGAVLGCFSARAEITLPASYTALSYVRSTGSQYIDTGVAHDGTYKVDIDLQFLAAPSSGGWVSAFGARSGSKNNDAFGLWIHNKSGTLLFWKEYGGSGNGDTSVGAAINTDYTVHLEKSGTCTVNGTTLGTGVSGISPRHDFLFAMNDNGNASWYSTARISSCKISAGSTLLRDFMPCRNDQGEAGFWDRVEGRFYGSATSTKLLGDDDEGVTLNYLESTGSNYVDTEIKHDANTVVDMKMRFLGSPSSGGWVSAFGARSGSKNNDAFGLWIHNNNYLRFWKEFGGSGNGDTTVGAQVDTDYIVHLEKSGACTVDGVTLGTGVGGTSPRNDYLFCLNDGGTARWHSKSRIYYCRIGSGSTVVADMKPYRKADGTICFFDSVRNKYLTPNTGALAWTFACTVDGTALCAHDGTLTDELFGDYAEVRKVSSRTLNAAGITSYPAALTLKSGRFALNDGEAKAVTVAGALKLHGDMRIDLDVGASACDRFAVGSLVFDESATAAHPVVICVIGLGIEALPEGASLPLVTGANLALTEADAQRFQVAGMTARVAVRDGALVLEPIPAVADAYWTGSAADDNWSSAENWRNQEMPMRGATVTFGETAGGSSRLDLGAFAVEQLVFGSGSGAYTVLGGDTLTVGKGISNASASAQTFTLPMALGEAGEPFAIETTGGLNLTEGVKTLADSELVKGGAGTLTLNDDTLAAAGKVTVTNGTLKLNNTGRVTAAAAAGELRILQGARLDVNINYGNAETFAKSEAVHAKTVYIEGTGPDGRGVVVNSNPAAAWGVTFGRVVLTGDATIGGEGHLSFRTLANSRVPNPQVEGAHTLTISNNYVSTSSLTWIPNFYSCAFALDRLDLHGAVQFEVAQTGAITNGIHCYGSSMLRFCNTMSVTAEMPVTIETGATVLNPNGGTGAFNGTFRVAAGATLTNNDVQVAFNGELTVDGTFVQVGATATTLGGRLAGNGTLAGGAVRFSGANTVWAMAADDNGFTTKVNTEQVTDAAFLAGLRRIEVQYAGEPATTRVFDLASSGTLTQQQVANQIQLVVTDGEGAPVANCWLEVTGGGRLALHIADGGFVRTATWRGGATGALDEPANWICSNDVVTIDGALPQTLTTLVLPDGCVFNCPAGSTLDYARIVFPASIGGDCDWRGLPDPTIDSTINLNGHKIYLSELRGTGALVGDEYEEVEYIESHAAEWIDTGYSHDGTTIVDMKIMFTGLPNNSWACYYGSRAGYDDTQFGGWISSYGHSSTTYHYSGVRKTEGDVAALGAVATGVDYVVHLEKNGVCTINGATLDTGAGGTASRNDLLFAMRDGPNNNAVRFPSQNRLYYCRIHSGATLVRDFVPVRRLADGSYGLIDRANGDKWYGNSGSNAFTGSAPLENATHPIGEVHLDVPAGKTVTNTSLALRGMVTLVKEGEGTFVANKFEQSYRSTRVVAGTATVPLSGETSDTYAFKHLQYGVGSASIVVEPGAMFDIKGNYDLSYYNVVLNGGTLANTGCKQTYYTSWGCGGNVTLTSDSFYRVDYWTSHRAGKIDLGGYALTATIPEGSCFFLDRTLTNGTLRTTGGGVIQFRTTTAKDLRTVDLVLGTASSVWDVDIDVRNLTTVDYDGVLGNGEKGINIHGVFKPVNDYVHNFTLQDRATIDLSERSTPFDLADKSLAFVADATIFVDVRGRRVANNTPVIAWDETSQPANLDTLSFTAPPGARYCVIKREDGVYIFTGLTLYLR